MSEINPFHIGEEFATSLIGDFVALEPQDLAFMKTLFDSFTVQEMEAFLFNTEAIRNPMRRKLNRLTGADKEAHVKRTAAMVATKLAKKGRGK